MLSLSEIYFKDLNSEKESLIRINLSIRDELQFKSDINFLWYYNQTFAVYQLNQGNIKASKQHFYTCGRIDEYLIKKFDSRRLDAGVANITYALLSESKSLMQRYALLSHSKYKWMVENGHSTLLYVIQQAIIDNWEQVNWGIQIMTTKNKKLSNFIKPDITFFEGLLIKDEIKMRTAVLQLLKDHKKRNRLMGVTEHYISIPALTYLKLAWLKGMEIEIEHPLIPKELLLYQPLDLYEDRYEFLKELNFDIN